MTPEEQAVEAKLKELDILYERHDHEPIMTVAEGQKIAEKLGSHCMKNLFLCAKKKEASCIHVGRSRLDAGLNPLMQKEFAHPMPYGRIL